MPLAVQQHFFVSSKTVIISFEPQNCFVLTNQCSSKLFTQCPGHQNLNWLLSLLSRLPNINPGWTKPPPESTIKNNSWTHGCDIRLYFRLTVAFVIRPAWFQKILVKVCFFCHVWSLSLEAVCYYGGKALYSTQSDHKTNVAFVSFTS